LRRNPAGRDSFAGTKDDPMTGAEQFAMLQEIVQQIELKEPRIAEKMRVMFNHIAHAPRDDTLNEIALRNFLITAAGLIDRYTLIDSAFNESQRAVLAAETLEILEGKRQPHLH
jgi:hypothetical protein